MKLKNKSITQIIRHLIQLIAFILFPGLFISILAALGDIIKALVTGTFSAGALSAQLITVIGVFIITALWGRFFCGFLCSFGALQDLFALSLKKYRLKHCFMPTRLDRVLKFLKYAVLAFLIVAVWILSMPIDSSLSPWGVFGMLTSGNISLISAAIPTIGFVILSAVMLASFFIERFFCRYLCPLGAIFALISSKRLFKIRCKGKTCVDCGLCTKKCAMGIDVAGQNEVTSSECINCMQCMSCCPRQSLSTTAMPAVAGTAAALAIWGVVTVGKITVPESSASTTYTSEEIQSDTDQVETVPVVESSGNSEFSSVADGVYKGSGMGFRGITEVSVTVENGTIVDITIDSYEDDEQFFSRAKSSVIDSILSEQTLNVSTVSGATFSGEGIIEAVADAVGFNF